MNANATALFSALISPLRRRPLRAEQLPVWAAMSVLLTVGCGDPGPDDHFVSDPEVDEPTEVAEHTSEKPKEAFGEVDDRTVVTRQDDALVAAAEPPCLDLKVSSIVLPAEKIVTSDLKPGSTLWPLGAVMVDVLTCKDPKRGWYIPIDFWAPYYRNYVVNLEQRTRGSSTTYAPVAQQISSLKPNFGHGIFFDGLTKVLTTVPFNPGRQPRPQPLRYAMRLKYMACSEEPLSFQDALFGSAKAILGLPLPTRSNVVGFGAWLISEAIPERDQKYQCLRVGSPVDLEFDLDANGCVRFRSRADRKTSYSYQVPDPAFPVFLSVNVNFTLNVPAVQCEGITPDAAGTW